MRLRRSGGFSVGSNPLTLSPNLKPLSVSLAEIGRGLSYRDYYLKSV